MKNEQEATVNTSPSEILNYFKCTKTLTTYYCDQCLFNTQLLVDLKRHTIKHATTFRSHQRSHLYLCNQCSYKTHSILILFNHYIRRHKFYVKHKWLKCKRCPNRQGSFSYLTCKKCSFTTKWKCRFRRHVMSTHPAEFPLWVKCTLCPFRTRQKSSLRRHVKALHTSVEKIQWFKCELCHHKTVRSDHMKRHMKEVHSCFIYKIQYVPKITGKDNRWLCAFCPWKSLNEASLQEHVRETHGILKDEEKVEEEIPKVLATNCPEIAENDHNVFLCAFCNGHNLYQCVFCHMKTISRRMLSKHIKKMHENNENVEEKATAAQTFSCEQCSFSTEWVNTLKLHNLLKHRKKDLLLNLTST